MWSFWAVALFAAPALIFLKNLVSLARNYHIARKTNLPIVVSPVHRSGKLWLVLQRFVAPVLAKAFWVRCNWYGQLWKEQDSLHRDIGKVYLNISADAIEVKPGDPFSGAETVFLITQQMACADLDVIRQVYARRKSFEFAEDRPKKSFVLLSHGISATGNALDWQRHRRILAPPFNENIMPIVWNEALRQVSSLCALWESYGKEGFSSRACFTDFKTVALNVLAKGGFGFSWDFVARGRRRCADDSNFATQYCDRLTLLMSGPDSTWIMATTPKFLYDHGPDYPWLLPENLRNHVVAARELKKQLEHLVAEKKAGLAAGEDENRNFLNELIANSEDVLQQSRLDDKAEKAEALRIPGFNEKEIFSNLINFGMAGYETTANTMAYCFHILSVHPEWQDWIQQELDHVLPDLSPDLGTPDYESTFPRLKRCMALMYEVVRLYPPLVRHHKEVLGEGQQLDVDGRTVFLPAGALIVISALAVQVMEEHWGPDSKVFRPSRWIQPAAASPSRGAGGGEGAGEGAGAGLDAEEFGSPIDSREAFLPWSLPARDCIGKKFAVVEFVAVLSYLLRRYRIEAVPLEGEAFEDTRARIMAQTHDSTVGLVLTMNMPPVEKPVLRLVERVQETVQV